MKKFLSVILAALILVCPLSSFATDAAETLEWYFCDDLEDCDPWIYNYKGDITLGKTEIKFTEDEKSDYYTFDAENAGYYYVECDEKAIDWLGFPESITNGKAVREAEGYFIPDSENETVVVFKLNAGETVMGFDFNGLAEPDASYEVEIEYLGDAIKDIVLEDDSLKNLVLDSDLFNDDASYALSDVGVVFSGGKTITIKDEWVQIDAVNYDWVHGENEATATYMGFKKNVTVTACEMFDLVKAVEFVNVDEFKDVVTTFNDDYAEYIYGAELVFTLADGKKVSINTSEEEYIKINGRYYYAYAMYHFNGAEDVEISVYVENSEIRNYECNVVKSSYVDGSEVLFLNLGTSIKDSFYYSRIAFSEFLRMYDIGDLEDAFSEASYYFRRSFESFLNCFTLIRLFMTYYF